jgi:hypothetical protein
MAKLVCTGISGVREDTLAAHETCCRKHKHKFRAALSDIGVDMKLLLGFKCSAKVLTSITSKTGPHACC